jgi:hypothetical protein
MDLNALRQALRSEPFQPFTIRLVDGRSVPVIHPEFVAVGPRVAIVVREDNSWCVIEPVLIVSLEYNGPAPKRRKRGDRGS